MKNLTENLGKKVVGTEEGKCFGYALDVCIDPLKQIVLGYIVCDEFFDGLCFVHVENLKASNDFLIVENKDMLDFGENIESFNPIQKQVVSTDGVDLGIVRQCDCEKNKIIKIITNKCEINPKNVNLNGEILIFSKNKKNQKNNLIFNKLTEKNENIVHIQENKKIQLPYKTSVLNGNIIGKISTADIFGTNNEIIIKKNQQITEKTVKSAKKHNKLNLLMFNCK